MPPAPIGTFDGGERAVTIATNDQMRAASQYEPLVIKAANGTVVRLSAIASIEPGVRNSRSFGWFNRQPSILLVLTKSADANVIETVDRVRAMLPEIKRWIPAGVDIEILSDRTQTIRASVFDMQLTLVIAIALVMMVVFLFLRRGAATIAAGVTVPLSLAGTCALMWVAGFSINNLSLMALVISVGFVVDDAIVMIENCFRNLEKGHDAGAGRAGRRAADRLHRGLDQHLADRRVHSAAVHDRRDRARVPRILGDARLRHRDLDGGVADAHADDLRAFRAQAAVTGRDLARPRRRAQHGVDGRPLWAQPAGGAEAPLR